MEIIEQEGIFNVFENGVEVYSAKSQEEAQGYIDWRNLGDAGKTSEDCQCN